MSKYGYGRAGSAQLRERWNAGEEKRIEARERREAKKIEAKKLEGRKEIKKDGRFDKPKGAA